MEALRAGVRSGDVGAGARPAGMDAGMDAFTSLRLRAYFLEAKLMLSRPADCCTSPATEFLSETLE